MPGSRGGVGGHIIDDVLRIGIGGPVGSGKTALVEALVPRLLSSRRTPAVITNDFYTQEDAEHVRRELVGILAADRVIGVETGSSPHTAVRDDPTMNFAAGVEMLELHPQVDTLLYESGGDSLALTFSPALVDVFVFVVDTSDGDKIPRKRGPGITDSDVLVINKIDIATYVRTNLDVMESDARRVRDGKPVILTNSLTGDGVDILLDQVLAFWDVRPPQLSR